MMAFNTIACPYLEVRVGTTTVCIEPPVIYSQLQIIKRDLSLRNHFPPLEGPSRRHEIEDNRDAARHANTRQSQYSKASEA